MKLYVTVCISVLVASSSIASAQIVTQCTNDALGGSDAQGRNSWAANCGYISPAARDFYNSDGDHITFTSGCGRPGCSPFVPITAGAGCISGLTTLGSCRDGYSLSVETEENEITVTSSRGVDTCDLGFCEYGYAGGSALTVRVAPATNRADCLRFTGWEGACAGQGSICSLTINGDLSTTALWGPIAGCSPCFRAPGPGGSIIICSQLPAPQGRSGSAQLRPAGRRVAASVATPRPASDSGGDHGRSHRSAPAGPAITAASAAHP
jgi:hypothetical protein